MEVLHSYTQIYATMSWEIFVGNLSYRRNRKLPMHFTVHILGHLKAQYRQLRPLQSSLNPEEYQNPVKEPMGNELRSLETHKYIGWGRTQVNFLMSRCLDHHMKQGNPGQPVTPNPFNWTQLNEKKQTERGSAPFRLSHIFFLFC